MALSGSVSASETDLRVAFVYQFTKFIDWPATFTASADICVLGADLETRNSFLALKQKLTEKQSLRIVFLNESTAVSRHIAECKIAYKPLHGVVVDVPTPLPSGVVLVVDEPSDIANVASIGLVKTSDGRITFDINKEALNLAGVSASSQILKLAQNLRGGGER